MKLILLYKLERESNELCLLIIVWNPFVGDVQFKAQTRLHVHVYKPKHFEYFFLN